MVSNVSNKNLGIHVPDVLLPAKEINMSTWAVVACDQYTSEPEYWAEVEHIVGDNPSTLNLTFPEIYLESGNPSDRINSINNSMRNGFTRGLLIGSIIGASLSMAMNSDNMNDRSRKKMKRSGRDLMRRSGSILGDVIELLK